MGISLTLLLVLSATEPDQNAIYEAVQWGDVDKVIEYLDAGGDPDLRRAQPNVGRYPTLPRNVKQETLLLRAIVYGKAEIVNLLIAHGASSKLGELDLGHLMIRAGINEAARTLLAKDCNSVDVGKLCYENAREAIQSGNSEILKMMLSEYPQIIEKLETDQAVAFDAVRGGAQRL